LVENAFKYGVSGSVKEAKIDINLQVSASKLSFDIFNTKPGEGVSENIKGNGIGITNLKRQLVLNYPQMHTLAIKETSEDYVVNLEINLNGVSHD